MDISVHAKALRGKLALPPFKSEVIRALILGALAGRRSHEIIDLTDRHCGDVLSAAAAVDRAFFEGADPDEPIPSGESAALLRMLAPVLLFKRGRAVFSCKGSLLHRGADDLISTLGCTVSKDEKRGTLAFSGGRLNERNYVVSAEKSSQFASGMLIASAVCGFAVRVASPVSMPYIELTLRCLERFGCRMDRDNKGFLHPFGGLSAPKSISFAPDMSYAANFTAAELICGGGIIMRGVERGENLPDARAAELFRMDCVDITDTPDLFPILCVHALKKPGDTRILGTARLSYKESDRIASVKALIEALGGGMEVLSNSVLLRGCGGKLHGGKVQSFGDHRIVMAAAVASLMCDTPVSITGAEAVNKSAPWFFDDFRVLGGSVNEYVRQ